MELQAILLKTTAVESGTNKNGEPWQKCYALLQTIEHYPKEVAIGFMNKLCTAIKQMPNGTLVKVKFDATSHEYNGRYYTEMNAWSLSNVAKDLMSKAEERQQSSGNSQMPQPQPIPTTVNQGYYGQQPAQQPSQQQPAPVQPQYAPAPQAAPAPQPQPQPQDPTSRDAFFR